MALTPFFSRLGAGGSLSVSAELGARWQDARPRKGAMTQDAWEHEQVGARAE
jgi:hypothetical protein